MLRCAQPEISPSVANKRCRQVDPCWSGRNHVPHCYLRCCYCLLMLLLNTTIATTLVLLLLRTKRFLGVRFMSEWLPWSCLGVKDNSPVVHTCVFSRTGVSTQLHFGWSRLQWLSIYRLAHVWNDPLLPPKCFRTQHIFLPSTPSTYPSRFWLVYLWVCRLKTINGAKVSCRQNY